MGRRGTPATTPPPRTYGVCMWCAPTHSAPAAAPRARTHTRTRTPTHNAHACTHADPTAPSRPPEQRPQHGRVCGRRQRLRQRQLAARRRHRRPQLSVDPDVVLGSHEHARQRLAPATCGTTRGQPRRRRRPRKRGRMQGRLAGEAGACVCAAGWQALIKSDGKATDAAEDKGTCSQPARQKR